MPRHATSRDDADRPPFVSIAEAARILHVSPTTIKRRIRAGTLEAEQLQRPQGFEYRVRVQLDGARDDAPPAAAPSVSKATTAHGPVPATTHDTTHARCFDELAAGRQTIERQAETIAGLREDRGRLAAELDMLRAAQAQQDANLTPASSASMLGPFPRSWAYGAATLLALVAVVVLLGAWRW